MNKLTLYISKDDVAFAKAHARRKSTSVSKLVSAFFVSLRRQIEQRRGEDASTDDSKYRSAFLNDFHQRLIAQGYQESSLSEEAARDAHLHEKYLDG